jgi:tetratricopeptide (TPR) repeat protein
MQRHASQSATPSRTLAALDKHLVAHLVARLAAASLMALFLSPTPAARAQASSDSQASAGAAPQPKSSALVNTAGPDVSLQNSEALFDVAAALNACGYDQGLDASDLLRQEVREQVNQALQGSADARDAHDQICTFIGQHRLSSTGSDLAQYISLALYITPPPDLTPSAEGADMPPDASQVENILPLLRRFAELANLHLIFLHVRPRYDRQLAQLHDSLTKMIVDTGIYLKTPAGTSSGQRFLVVVEPLLDPVQTNARVYGADYVVVVSPVHGAIHMREVRHAYLHYQIEPMLYARATTLDRLLPFLKTVRDAPLDYTYRSDIVALVVECMIRAIEARTMDTGVAIYKIAADVRRSDLESATHQHNTSVEAAEAVRRHTVQQSMADGYVLTEYFYNAFAAFERAPQSFKESIGEMVYGMDVSAELNRAKHVAFNQESSSDVVHRSPREPRGLDLAELKLVKGDTDGAAALAQQSVADKSGDPARANFILARVAIMQRDVPGAQHDFAETIRLSKDPRMLAWSHIYLGRIYDIQDEREQAVAEYQAALTVRDGQPDTRQAAEKGLKQPYAVPRQEHTEPAGDDDAAPDAQKLSPQPQADTEPPAASPR